MNCRLTLYFLLGSLILKPCTANAQIPKSAFSIKANGGYSLSAFSNKTDFNIKNKYVQVICPQLNYNFLTKKSDIVEVGIGLYNLGNLLSYYDNAGNTINSTFNSNQVFGLPVTFYKNIDKENNQFYLGLGSVFSYNFTHSVFVNTYTDYTETTRHLQGLKVNLTGSVRYFFKARNRNFSAELNISKGLTNYYKMDIVSNYSAANTTILHKGTALQIGLSYFFLKKEVE